ncbi:chloramphenicol phosphotransferase CPT family protein [uncultured Ruegeria sp.]|uniref:chloramphenicol phosphotransferase CPT family protein n=1 Tax=uncultured Ruegeria sp. TaxID=259304 RepID=UPI00260606B1|nr:AAA family ATPase [uncultured Ruegeria sp.]
MSQIIFLHGASSSGKSTIARALQQQIEVPFWHVSIDHLRDAGVLPMARYRAEDFDWPSDRSPIFDGFHRSVSAYADAGNNLILEHILDTPGWAEDLKTRLESHDVLFVAVQCPISVLIERERLRGDRPLGSAARDQERIHEGRVYDLEVNGTEDVAANVGRILTAWRSGERRSEFSHE